MSKIKMITIWIYLPLFFLIAGGDYCYGNNEVEDVFINQMGKEVRLSDFKNKVVLMTFSYTSCPETGCYLLGMQLLRAQLRFKNRIGKDLFLLNVSIDPEKDTPEVLMKSAEKYKVVDHKGWFFLTGNTEAIDRLRKKYGVEWETGPDGNRYHEVAIVLLNQKGETEKVYDSYIKGKKKIIEDIKTLLNS